MKKRLVALTLILGLSLSLAACGGNKPAEPAADTENKTEVTEQTPVKEEETANTEEQKTIEGTLTEKKDMQFVIKNTEGKEYLISLKDPKAVEGYENLKVGDNVTVTYTGELSEIDPFNGEVISIVVK